METKQDIKALFLREFFKRIIIKSLPRAPHIRKEDSLIEKLDKESVSYPIMKITARREEALPVLPREFFQEEKKEIVTKEKARPLPVQIIQAQPQKIIPKKSAIPAPVLNQLIPYINDPSVQMINCPGPERAVLVTRFGSTQQTPLVFDSDEIKSFLSEISEKTRIPLLTGVFKVAYQNFILTAAVSDFIGSSFIIEKKQIRQPSSSPLTAQRITPVRVTFK